MSKNNSSFRKPQPSEGGIVGQWIFENGKMFGDYSCQRIDWLVNNYLQVVNSSDGGWTKTYQDPEDGRYWQHTYPKSYMQGGGPPMLEYVTPVTIAYKQIKDALIGTLNERGYEMINERYYFESFGSRYTVWSNHQRAFRLIWDGKERQFVLERANTLPLSEATHWADVITINYDARVHDNEYLNRATQEIVDTFRKSGGEYIV